MALNTEIQSQKHLLTQLKQSILQEAIQGKLTADWRAKNIPKTSSHQATNSPPLEGCPAGGVVKKRNSKNYFSLPYNPKLKQRAKDLRKAGNLSEVLFWNEVKRKQFKGLDFDRQKIIGNYIVDFYCPNCQVVIEIDGSSHDNKQDYDAKRDAYLESLGLTVIHITDIAIKKNLAHTMNWLLEHPALEPPRPADTPPEEGNWEPASELLKRIKAEKAQLIKDKKIRKEKPLPPITKEEIPFDLPEGWVWCRLGEIIINSDNLNIHKELSVNELINYVDIDTIDNKLQIIKEPKILPVNQLSSRARRVLKQGNIMYSLVRPYLHNLAIIEDNKTNYIGSTGFAVFDCLNIENKYIFWLLLSKYIEDLYLNFMDGFNSPSITHDQFKKTIIPVPPVKEQKEIVKRVEKLMQHCQDLEQEIQKSETNAQMLMQAVLKEAFEGGTKKKMV